MSLQSEDGGVMSVECLYLTPTSNSRATSIATSYDSGSAEAHADAQPDRTKTTKGASVTNGAIRSADVEVFTRQVLATLGDGLALSANPREAIRAAAAVTLAFRRELPRPTRDEVEARLAELNAKPAPVLDDDDEEDEEGQP